MEDEDDLTDWLIAREECVMDLDDEELKATRKLNGVAKENNIEEIKKNIKYWEDEVQKALKENDIGKAIGCRVLANNLRKDLGEEEI